MTIEAVEVNARWDGHVWRLEYVEPCAGCNSIHRHGGGRGPEPDYGSRGTHCGSSHKPFRPDCERRHSDASGVRSRGARCYLRHVEMVELVPIEKPETASWAR